MEHISNSAGPSGSQAATELHVVDNPAHERFDLWLGDEIIGILGYRDEDDIPGFTAKPGEVVAFMHTVVKEEHGGRGMAAILVREGLAAARVRGWRVRPICTYVQRYLAAHPEENDLLVSD
ncbi:MAG: N-acetyltransferase [Rhodococcus sp.]|nr:N-acetyltransferase [Rhodococcus sp. (in: high G+C Gram-positive bacteria)]